MDAQKPAWSEAFNTSMTRGKCLWDRLQHKVKGLDMTPDRIDAEARLYNPDLFDVKFNEKNIEASAWTQTYLAHLGLKPHDPFNGAVIEWAASNPTPCLREKYHNMVRVGDGVLLAIRNNSNRNKAVTAGYSTEKDQNPLHLSDALFYLWQDLATAAQKRIDSLQYVIQDTIRSDGRVTEAIVKEAYDSARGAGAWDKASMMEKHGTQHGILWMADDIIHRDAFYALLGTTVGKSQVFMLADHFQALHLTIVSVETWRVFNVDERYGAPSPGWKLFMGFKLAPVQQGCQGAVYK